MNELWHYEIWTPWGNRLLVGNLFMIPQEAEDLSKKLSSLHGQGLITDFSLDPGGGRTTNLPELSKVLSQLAKYKID